MTLRSQKMIWVCILCRKKQELLLKSGRWLETTSSSGGVGGRSGSCGGGLSAYNSFDPVFRKIELDMELAKLLGGGGMDSAAARAGATRGRSASHGGIGGKILLIFYRRSSVADSVRNSIVQ